jgi:hypothetical protein
MRLHSCGKLTPNQSLCASARKWVGVQESDRTPVFTRRKIRVEVVAATPDKIAMNLDRVGHRFDGPNGNMEGHKHPDQVR